jgi:GMP synthase-like glutamine amidotransferase
MPEPDPQTVLLLQHQDDGGPGNLLTWLDKRGIPWELVDVSAGSLPPVAPRRAIVVLGSEEAAYDPAVAWLPAEKAFLAQSMALGTPVLGLCFGGQLIADVLGGQVTKADVAEIGWVDVAALPNSGHSGAAADPADAAVPGTWFAWHYDQFQPPPGSTVLAATGNCLHAFRHGRHLALQFHPEVAPEQIELWLNKMLRQDPAAMSAEDARRLLDESERRGTAARDAAFQLYASFFGESTL